MKIGLLITARLGSSRLPKKHLIEAGGKPFMFWLFSRFEREFETEIKSGQVKIVLATSDREENKLFENVVKGTTVDLFFGSDDKVPLRHYQCAQKYNFDLIISVDGDDILCSVKAARALLNEYIKNNNYDIYSVTGLPLGMNLMAYTTVYLKKSLAENTSDNKLETGWGRIFINPRKKEIKMGEYDINSELRFTLDYPADADFFKAVIEGLKNIIYTFTDDELIRYVQQHKLTAVNGHLKEEYWENYYSEKKREEQNDNK